MPRCATAGSRRRRSRCSARTPIRRRCGAAARKRFASGACARSRTGISAPRRGPGSRCASAARARCSRRSSTATTRRSRCSSSTPRACASAAAGRRASAKRASSGSRRSTAASRWTARPFRHVFVATGHPGLAHPERVRQRLAHRPRVPAARVRGRSVTIVGAGMAAAHEWLNALAAGAEVISIRRREPLRRPLNVPRALLLQARARAVSTRSGPSRGRRRCASCRAVVSAGRRVGRAASPRRSRGALPRRDRAERHRAGDLRDRLRARLAERPAACAARRRARARHARPLDRARARLDRRPSSPTTPARSRSPASPASGRSPPPTRSRARSTPPAASCAAYVVHAEGPHRDAARGCRAGAAACARAAPLVGDRARRADARARRSCSTSPTTACSTYQPAWFAVPLGALELALVYGAMRALEHRRPAPAGARALRGRLAERAALRGTRSCRALRLEYGESGGELGRTGAATAVAVALTLVGGLGAAYAVRPPTVHLHGTVQGPLVITRSETLVGGVVRGGIVIRANHVTLRHVTVVGGEYGDQHRARRST